MRAIYVTASDVLEFKDVPSSELKDHEVRIEVAVAGVCGSDLKNIRDPVVVPQIPGHEFSGRIIELGRGCCEDLVVGQRVTVFPMIGCGHCAACRKEDYRECPDKQSLGFQLPGAFAEEVSVPDAFVIPLREEISYEQGSFVEPLSCGIRLVKEILLQDGFSPEDRVLIIGDGLLAWMDVISLSRAGFTKIFLVGKHEYRKSLALRIGVAHVVDYERVQNLSLFEKFDVCIFAAKADSTLKEALPFLRTDGLFLPQVSVGDWELKQQICAKLFIGRAFAYLIEDFVEAMEYIIIHGFRVNDIVTQRYTFDDLSGDIKTFYDKRNMGKVLIINSKVENDK